MWHQRHHQEGVYQHICFILFMQHIDQTNRHQVAEFVRGVNQLIGNLYIAVGSGRVPKTPLRDERGVFSINCGSVDFNIGHGNVVGTN